jgi:hypothetical protein
MRSPRLPPSLCTISLPPALSHVATMAIFQVGAWSGVFEGNPASLVFWNFTGR